MHGVLGRFDAQFDEQFGGVGGQFDDARAIAEVNLRIGDRFFNLSDVATVRRGYTDPPESLFRFNGQEAIGLQVAMRQGENIQTFGAELDALMATVAADLPVGIEMHKTADQPHVVTEAVSHFIRALAEAVGIVLIVSFVSLGFRAGFVVTLTIPLVLAITFVILEIYGITLQRISLGALIIALGLLVDDAPSGSVETLDADGLVVPGVGAFAACMQGLNAVGGPRIVGQRLAGAQARDHALARLRDGLDVAALDGAALAQVVAHDEGRAHRSIGLRAGQLGRQ